MILNQKETTLLQDIKSQEQLCVDKYTACSEKANDPQLKQLFDSIRSTEEQHLDTINQILNGTVPSLGNDTSTGKSSSSGGSTSNSNIKTDTTLSGDARTNDKYLCADTLATEKHVSSVYNTSIFEFRDEKIRDVLNHIQTEEQQHGKEIYDYMSQHNMYQS